MYKPNPEFSTFITRAVALHLDSSFYYSTINKKLNRSGSMIYSFPIKRNAFRFYFSSPTYDAPQNIEYSFKLSGYNDVWSEWSPSSSYEYANLPEGKFVFTVKAKNQLGFESLSDSIEFKILPPWYKSILAYISYGLLSVLFILLIIWYFYRRIEFSNRKERFEQVRKYREKEQDYKKQVQESEQKIEHLENEKLRIEMINRNKELANQTMHLIRKNRSLVKVKEELQKIRKNMAEEIPEEKISSIITRIDKDIDNKKQWEVFESYFDKVHEDFLNRLKTSYPSLTPKELRLCAYLRMNISTKEIAPLMNISIRGVEICRYRVRKKLNIDRDTNLTKMIIDF
jgi:DNA-binding CsgD family transcriptional regulator